MHQEPLSILIADDEETFAKLLADQLREEFLFSTTYVTNGREVIELLKNSRHGFDVILLDYKMPDMTGLNVMQWMHEQKVQTPVVILTAAGSETVAVESMKLGAYDYLRKEQVEIDRLAHIIQSTHERHLFRVIKQLEEERWREIGLNKEATDRVRDILSAITPKLNETFASMAVSLEHQTKALKELPKESREEIQNTLTTVQRHVTWLETAVQALLSLYSILYARYTESQEIEKIKKEIESAARRTTSEEKRPRVSPKPKQ